ncbi:MAG: hypothetical protein H6604_00690 [Flavobacteriales bacterium]|nr:hypothetical protein [Flavobacteriales bacterium]
MLLIVCKCTFIFKYIQTEKLGYDVIFISKYNKVTQSDFSIRIELVSKVEDMYRILF